MSWYMFRQTAVAKPRGIKVQGFPQMHRPKLNLSWGMNEPQPPSQPQHESHILPSTIVQKHEDSQREKRVNAGKVKVLTETSDDEEQQLMKLVRDKGRKDEEVKDYNNKNRSQSGYNIQYSSTNKPYKQSNPNTNEFSKRMRYLQNSLLPHCRRDTMDSILDHDLSKQVPLSQSRMSSKSNKKNESSVVLGVGYNAFSPPSEVKKDLMQQLQEMYEYEDRCKKRKAGNQFNIG